jgi:hypothetical protein
MWLACVAEYFSSFRFIIEIYMIYIHHFFDE